MNLFTIRQKLNMGYKLNDLELRVTYYSRVSTEHEEQKKSLINQSEYFDKMIKENSNWKLIDGYIDDGISGTSDIKRNSFMKMINDAKKDKFDLIITKEISRFSRNTLDSIKYTRELLNNGVAVLFLNDNINTIFPDSELRLTIMASMAQDEIRRLSERVKFGMHRAQEKGELLGNNIIYGYKKNKQKKRLEIIKKEAKIVQRIFQMYVIDDYSLTKIKNVLNSENIKTKENKNWSTTTISRIIKNPKYKGFYCGKKVEVIDYMSKKIKYYPQEEWITYKDKKVPLIIDEYLWQKANQKLSQKTKKREKKQESIYTNKIYCQNDNHIYYPKKFRRNKEISWVCSNYLINGKNICDTANIRECELNEIMYDILKESQIKENVKNLLHKKYKDKLLEEKINELLERKVITDKIIRLLINNIVVRKEGKEKFFLKIFLNFKLNATKEYFFKRGYDTKYTKKYTIKYIIEILYR